MLMLDNMPAQVHKDGGSCQQSSPLTTSHRTNEPPSDSDMENLHSSLSEMENIQPHYLLYAENIASQIHRIPLSPHQPTRDPLRLLEQHNLPAENVIVMSHISKHGVPVVMAFNNMELHTTINGSDKSTNETQNVRRSDNSALTVSETTTTKDGLLRIHDNRDEGRITLERKYPSTARC
jgi:hypothetical protein